MPFSTSVATLRELLESSTPPIVIDVRRQQAFTESPSIIPGALRHLPEQVETWGTALPPGRHVVVYCVHGHQVSQVVAAQLERLGMNASFLEGGIVQWETDGGATLSGGA